MSALLTPGVGTKRRAIIIKTKRGDYLIGPDNGALISAATNILEGCERVVEITNSKYMKQPVSPIFHSRSIFAPAAAYLSIGVPIEEFGKELRPKDLIKAPYGEAIISGNSIGAQVIHINKYGSLHLNILHATWDMFSANKNEILTLQFSEKKIELPFAETFGDVAVNTPMILKDDYGRVEVAVNRGSFSKKYGVNVGDKITIEKKQ